MSSVSSAHSVTIANVLHNDNTQIESSERHPHRPSYVSDVSEVSVSSEGTRPRGVDTSGLGRIDD